MSRAMFAINQKPNWKESWHRCLSHTLNPSLHSFWLSKIYVSSLFTSRHKVISGGHIRARFTIKQKLIIAWITVDGKKLSLRMKSFLNITTPCYRGMSCIVALSSHCLQKELHCGRDNVGKYFISEETTSRPSVIKATKAAIKEIFEQLILFVCILRFSYEPVMSVPCRFIRRSQWICEIDYRRFYFITFGEISW